MRRRSGDSNTASRLARARTVPAGRGRLCPARPRVPAVLLEADRYGRLPGWRHRCAEPAGDALRAETRAGEAAVHLHAVRRAPVRCGERCVVRDLPGRAGGAHDRAAAGGGVPFPGARRVARAAAAFAIAAVGIWLEPVAMTLFFGQINLVLLPAARETTARRRRRPDAAA